MNGVRDRDVINLNISLALIIGLGYGLLTVLRA